MVRKIIIIILILLILISLGIIGYLALSSNPNFNWGESWPFGSRSTKTIPLVPTSFFPTASTTQDSRSVNQNPNSFVPSNNGVGVSPPEVAMTMAGTSALGLTITNNNKTEQVFFVDRATGNLYEITPNNDLLRLTGDTLNDLREIYWGQDKAGKRLILRLSKFNHLMTINSLVKPATTTGQLGTVTNQILDTNISAVAISPNGSKFFTLETTTAGVIGYLNDWTGNNKKKLWSFPFGDWQVTWPQDNIVSLTTTPSGSDLGYLYFLNPNSGSLTKILKGVSGLTASISPSGQRLIYASSNLSSLTTYFYDVTTQKASLLGLKTLPEKCTWSDNETLYCAVPRNIPSGLYPDNWYQGKIAFTDDIWEIDLSQTQPLTTLAIQLKSSYDLVNLVIAPERGWLYAINKPDNSIQVFALPIE